MPEPTDTRLLAPSICQVLGLRPPAGCEVGPFIDLVETFGGPFPLTAVVFDGFGVAALERFPEVCPNMSSVCRIHFSKIRAVPPPKTPVNFASMATGASRTAHGIDQKTDPLTMETVFHVMKEAGKTSCVGGRASGSPANLFRDFCTYKAVADTNTDREVLELTLGYIFNTAPDFTLVQFLDVDNAGHKSGPFSPEAQQAIRATDSRLGSLVAATAEIDGGLLVLADHGQHTVVDAEGIARGRHDGSCEQDFIVPLAWCSPSELRMINSTADRP